MRKLFLSLVALAALPACANAANLLVNGDFEASTSHFTTPPGWTNIGHTEGVISYGELGLPAYDGDEVYVFGGVSSNGFLSAGEGIGQSVATTAGDTYRLTFGYTGENCPGCVTVFTVNIGGFATDLTITADASGFFHKAFTTTDFDYVATGANTAISFIAKSSTNWGNNDPILDKVSFEKIASGTPTGGVPEPATWAMMILGFGLTGASLRHRRAALA